MKRVIGCAAIFCLGTLVTAPLGLAQTPETNVYFGAGTAVDTSNGQAIDPFGTGTFTNTPKITGLFLDAGGGMMLSPHFGAGANVSWRAAQGNYSGLNYRPIFYDFNAIWQPTAKKRFVPEIQGGLGGVKVGFSANQQLCDQLVGCSTVSLGSESSSHFQTHFGAAARFYVTSRLFLRPAVDVHWVNNFFQFGSNWVPEYTMSVGYTFGGER